MTAAAAQPVPPKSHTLESLESCGAEVQKGNAPEERKLQRLFRNPEATRLIKRCNDFGAGGVCVLPSASWPTDCILISSKVPKKYEGLDGTELAISESQERMAVVVAKEDAETFRALASTENLESTVVAEVTEQPRLVMELNGRHHRRFIQRIPQLQRREEIYHRRSAAAAAGSGNAGASGFCRPDGKTGGTISTSARKKGWWNGSTPPLVPERC